MMLLKRLYNASPMRGLSVSNVDNSHTVQTYTEASAISLSYYSAGTLTTDSGQAAGTVVVFQLTCGKVKNALGSMEATNDDTSLSFTSTALTSEVAFPWYDAEKYDEKSGSSRATAITANLKNGQYCIDYTHGTGYGKKADTSTTLTGVSYKIQSGLDGGDTVVTGAINIEKINGSTVAATNPLFVQMTDGNSVFSSTNPFNVKIGDATSQVSVIPTINSLKTDISSYGGTAVGLANPIHVLLTDGVKTAGIVSTYGSLKTDLTSIAGIVVKNFVFAEDSVHVSGDGGVHILTVRDDSPVAKAGTDGDYQSLTTDSVGALWVQTRGYDTGTDSIKSYEVAPLSSQHAEETLINASNITTNTTTYAYIDMDGYRYLSLQGVTSGAAPTDVLTVTVEATNQDDGTVAASCSYSDITALLYDAATGAIGTVSWADTNFMATFPVPYGFKYVRVKYVTSNGAGNDADLVVYDKKMF